MKHLMLIILLLVSLVFSVHGQNDPWLALNVLLDQAETALDNGDLAAAQSLIEGAVTLLSDEMIEDCDGAVSARVLLQQATTTTDVSTTQALLGSARMLIDSCIGETNLSAVIELPLPVTTNDDWQPVTQEFDDVWMALVPPGCFMMGSDEGDENELPVHEFCFDEPYWIDVYEVTIVQYGGPDAEPRCPVYSSEDDQPQNCISWFDAQAFCEARGGSLPNEAEWEYAARGPDSLTYTWGNSFDPDNVVYSENSGNVTAPVGGREGGASWVGAEDMIGNVSEWTTTIITSISSESLNLYPYPYDPDDGRDDLDEVGVGRVTRGGDIRLPVEYLRTSARTRAPITGSGPLLGFRCVREWSTDSSG